MSIVQIDPQSLLGEIRRDGTKKRFNAKVFLINNLADYFSLVEKLEDMADLVIPISSPAVCKGEDTIPDLTAILPVLDKAGEKNVLITSVGEYLRVGMPVEATRRSLFSIIGHQAHSTKRVWIPIFAAKEEFLAVVGDLDEEHYPQIVYEVDGIPSGFETTVYARNFAKIPGMASVTGIRAWLSLWDKKTVKSGMSFATRYAKQIRESDGIYTLNVVTEPFQYLLTRISEEGGRLRSEYGTDLQWLFLASKVTEPETTIGNTIEAALNLQKFDPHQILSGWNVSDDNKRWLFWLWYKLGLNPSSDYISFAVSKAKIWKDIPRCLECAILQCFDNPSFDTWIEQRGGALKCLSIQTISEEFWAAFDSHTDTRKKMKLLSGRTHGERAKIIELLSREINSGKRIADFKTLLSRKFPDLLSYLDSSHYLPENLGAYIAQYKQLKIKDEFSRDFSDKAAEINFFEFDTRSQILGEIKNSRDAYYLWIDGLGVEWIDLLVQKIAEETKSLSDPVVSIGAAVLPTETATNMACADKETVSLKLENLDSLGHIKDRSDCNYFSIIDKQISLIASIAHDTAQIAGKYPDKDIVITSDHGMSRMAAKGFHAVEGVTAPKAGKVCSLGRYCEFPSEGAVPDISYTVKRDKFLAFKTHAHFSVGGYAPGEIHGGASPEEILVPVIHYRRKNVFAKCSNANCSYSIDSTVTLRRTDECELHIKTTGPVEKVTVEIQSTRIAARKISDSEWAALVKGLLVNHQYSLQIYLNNIYTAKEETIYVKASGMAFDDTFDL